MNTLGYVGPCEITWKGKVDVMSENWNCLYKGKVSSNQS